MNSQQLKSIGLIVLGSAFLIGLILWNTKIDVPPIQESIVQKETQTAEKIALPNTAWENATSTTTTSLQANNSSTR